MNTSNRPELLDALREELREVRNELPPQIPEDALFMTDLGMDSLDIVEFVARVELACQRNVPDEQWETLSCLGRVADFLSEAA